MTIPGIGPTSCKQINEMYSRCLESQSLIAGDTFCRDFKSLSNVCYTTTREEFDIFARKLVHESDGLLHFLEKNGSQIPDKLKLSGFLPFFQFFSDHQNKVPVSGESKPLRTEKEIRQERIRLARQTMQEGANGLNKP